MEKLYQVFISSTYTDLVEERKAVANALAKSGYFVSGMEFFPASSVQQFDYIKRLIDRCDYYVLIVAGRYGSLNDEGMSYTEAEYRHAKNSGKPILCFIRNDIDSISLAHSEKDADLRKKLDLFRNEIQSGRLVNYWSSVESLAAAVAISVQQEINLNPQIGWVRGDKAADPKLFEEIIRLRAENSQLTARITNQVETDSFPSDLEGPDDIMTVKAEFIASSRKTLSALGETSKSDQFKKTYEFTTTWGDFFTLLHKKISIGEAEVTDIRKLPISKEKILEIYKPPIGYQIYYYDNLIRNITEIEIQYSALGLIVPSSKNAKSSFRPYNDEPEQVRTWQLTDKGRRFMLNRLAKKKTDGVIPALSAPANLPASPGS